MSIHTLVKARKFSSLKNGGWFFIVILIISACTNKQPLSTDSSLPLFDDLGSYHYPVSTSNPTTQRYFDQKRMQNV